MKKFIFLLAAFALVWALAGCSGSESAEGNTLPGTETLTPASPPLAGITDGPPPPDGAASPETQTPGSSADAPGDLRPVEATLENPAKIGEWVKVTHSYLDENDQTGVHTAYCRIIGVERGEAGQQAVDKYNEEHKYAGISDLDDPDLEYCLLTYEVFFPESFPMGKIGTTTPEQRFSPTGTDGRSVTANGVIYILPSAVDVSDKVEVYTVFPGDVWQGKAVFPMVKGFGDYLFATGYKENDEHFYAYITGQ